MGTGAAQGLSAVHFPDKHILGSLGDALELVTYL